MKRRPANILNWSLSPSTKAMVDRVTAIGLPALIGVVLITLAVPRMAAEVRIIPADNTLEKVRSLNWDELQDAPKAEALSDAVVALEAGQSIHDRNADLYSDVAFAQLRQVDLVGIDSEAGKALLSDAIENLKAGLKRNPANSFAWARLSYALLLQNGEPTDEVLEALAWSYQTGPIMEKLLYFRTDLSLRLWPHLDFAGRDFAIEQIRFYWKIDWNHRKELMSLACRYDAAFIIQNAVVDLLEAKDLDWHYRDYMSPEGCQKQGFL